MATNKTQAAKLLSTAEMAVYSASLAPAIKELSAARLTGKIKRARTLRDKFRDLLKRQKIATRGRTGTKVGTSGIANERTAMKAGVFDEVLQRYTARLEQVQAMVAREAARLAAAQARADKAAATAAKRAAPQAGVKTTIRAAVKKIASKLAPTRTPVRAARSAKAPAVAPGTAGVGVGPGSQRARAEAKTAQLAAARTRPIQGHISGAGRRTQAKRDARR